MSRVQGRIQDSIEGGSIVKNTHKVHAKMLHEATPTFAVSDVYMPDVSNIDEWAIEGICKPVYYSNACKE